MIEYIQIAKRKRVNYKLFRKISKRKGRKGRGMRTPDSPYHSTAMLLIT